jgi:hypothetical protein
VARWAASHEITLGDAGEAASKLRDMGDVALGNGRAGQHAVERDFLLCTAMIVASAHPAPPSYIALDCPSVSEPNVSLGLV